VVVIATRLLKLYHFTDSKNLPGVRKRGLRPHVGAMSEWNYAGGLAARYG